MTSHVWESLLQKGLSIFREVKKSVSLRGLWDYARGEWEVTEHGVAISS